VQPKLNFVINGATTSECQVQRENCQAAGGSDFNVNKMIRSSIGTFVIFLISFFCVLSFYGLISS